MKEPRLFLTDYITIELCLVAHLTSAQNCTFPLSIRCPSIVPVVKISLLARKITGGIPNIAWIPRGHPFLLSSAVQSVAFLIYIFSSSLFYVSSLFLFPFYRPTLFSTIPFPRTLPTLALKIDRYFATVAYLENTRDLLTFFFAERDSLTRLYASLSVLFFIFTFLR